MSDGIVLLRATLALLLFLQAGLFLLLFLIDIDSPHDGDGAALSVPESLSLAFGFGVGLITLEMLLVSVAGFPFRLPALLAPWALAWAIVASTARGRQRLRRLLRRRADTDSDADAPKRETNGQQLIATILLCLLSVLVAIVLYHAWLLPVFHWDSWAIWDLKARAFLHDDGIKPFLSDGYYALTHLEYPLLHPLAGTFLYLLIGAPHRIVQIIPALFYVCTLVLYACAMRRLGASNVLTLAFTFGLACMPPELYAGLHFHAEGAYVYYIATLSIYLFLYLRQGQQGQRSFLLISAFAAGLMTQVRLEGYLLLLVPVGTLVIRALVTRSAARRQAVIACLLYGGIALALYLPWAIASRFLTNPSSRYITGGFFHDSIAGKETLLRQSALRLLTAIPEWLLEPRFLGPLILLAPLALLLIVLQRRLVSASASAFLLGMAIWSYAPYIGFLIIMPYWPIDAIGRYFVAATVVLYFFVTSSLLIAPPRLLRAVLAIGGVGMVLWLGADLLHLLNPSPLEHARPVETAQDVVARSQTFPRMTELQRIQQLEYEFIGGMRFSAMLSALVGDPRPLPNGDVLLFRSTANPESGSCGYICQRLTYLLYPHKVRVIDDADQLRHALETSQVAVLVVYNQPTPFDSVEGDAIFRVDARYAVIRAPRLRPVARSATATRS